MLQALRGRNSQLMRSILLFTAFLFCGSLAQAVEILYSKHRDDDSFKRISEHFTGKENAGRYALFRTDATQRDGYYVALKREDSDPMDRVASLRIQYVRPGSMEIESQTLSTGSIQKKRILVGLTDSHWSQSSTIPTAWKIDFIDAQGKSLFHSQSFLWEARKVTTSLGF